MNGGSQLVLPFSWSKVCLYVGLANSSPNTALTGFSSARPSSFVGVRYDTDLGQTYTLSAAANASGGNTVYTGSITSGGTNNFVGEKFVVAGFSNAANNGTFTCVANSTTSLTLNNPGGIAETHAGTAAEQGTGDTQFVFECVSQQGAITANSIQRNSAQGNTFATGMTVTEGTDYRLEIVCTTAGSVQMTLSNGTTSVTATLAMPLYTATRSTSSTISNGLGLINWSPNPFSVGSQITASGYSGSLASLNGTFRLVGESGGEQLQILMAGSTSGAQSVTVSGYPSLSPWFAFGNDSQASPAAFAKAVGIDRFAWVWNPGVAGLASATPNPLKARYW
jgi:hypothetical protein